MALAQERRLPIRIRVADASDAPMIYSNWLKSYHGQNKSIPKAVMNKLHRQVVGRLLGEAHTVVAVIDLPDMDDEFCGWLCADRTDRFFICHWGYVKREYRTFGVMTAMLNAFDYKRGEPTLASHDFVLRKDLRRHNISLVPHLCHEGGLEQVNKLYNGELNAVSEA